MNRVILSRGAVKDLERAPDFIRIRFQTWVDAVREFGVENVRKRPGLHDEPLKGDRVGQRSVRLNRAWRAIYVIVRDGKLELLRVEEITHHGY